MYTVNYRNLLISLASLIFNINVFLNYIRSKFTMKKINKKRDADMTFCRCKFFILYLMLRLEELFAQELERETACNIVEGGNSLPSDLCDLPAHIPPTNYNRGSTRSSLSSMSAD